MLFPQTDLQYKLEERRNIERPAKRYEYELEKEVRLSARSAKENNLQIKSLRLTRFVQNVSSLKHKVNRE